MPSNLESNTNLREFTTGQLIAELTRRKDQLLGSDGLVVPAFYDLWVKLKPISNIDMILVRIAADGNHEIGVIVRATGKETNFLALIGGGINKNELRIDAMARHLRTDLGIRNFRLHPPQTIESPFYAAEYLHAAYRPGIPHLFDPSKHSVALTYLVKTNDPITPKNEAGGVVWLREKQIPERTAYNQGIIMRAAFDYLRNHP